MKTKFIFTSLAALLLSVASCTVDDKNVIPQLGEKPVIVSPEEGNSITLNPANPTNTAITIVWNHAKYAVNTEINYVVEMDKAGDNFDTPIELQAVPARQASLNVEQFNQKVLDAGLIPFATAGVEIRVRASLGSNSSMEIISDKIAINVTPFTTELPKLAVAGNHQGWNPPTAPVLASSAYGATDYEGFVWLNGEYKFVAPNAAGQFAWGNTDYGDDGTFAGVLVATGETNCVASTAGYYYVKANTATGTYSADPASWAITGAATPNGWPDPAPDHDMTYNPTTKKWEITIALTAGEFKFRANNGWSLNLGGDNNGDGSMDFGGPNLSVATAGTYTVILDLSNPRAYTYSIQ